MANGTVSFTGSIRYVGPGGVTVQEPVSASVPYNDSNAGIIDVAASTPAATLFPIPVGSIANVKAYYIANKTGQDLGVRFNGVGADEFQIPTGSSKMLFCPTDPAANPLTAITLTTTAMQVADGTIEFRVFGD